MMLLQYILETNNLQETNNQQELNWARIMKRVNFIQMFSFMITNGTIGPLGAEARVCSFSPWRNKTMFL